MNIFKKITMVCVAAVAILAAETAKSQLVYYSDNLLNTNFVINASGTTAGSTTNLISRNYASSLPDGWMSTKGLTALNPNANVVTFEFATMQLPTGFTGSYYTNAGFIYTNGITITNVVVPQAASNLVATIALMLDDASKALKLPPSTNNVITVTNTASALTNGIQNWITSLPATNFLGAKWFKVTGLTYNGSNALQVVSSRAGLWTGSQ